MKDYGRFFKGYLKIPFKSTLPTHMGSVDERKLIFVEDEEKLYLGKSDQWVYFSGTSPYTAGTRLLLQSMESSEIGNYTSYTTVRTIQIDRPGTLRISFKLTAGAYALSGSSATSTAYGRIYRDRGGTVYSVSPARSVSVTSTGGLKSNTQTYSQDISWLAGDRVLFRGYCTKSLGGSMDTATGGLTDIELRAGNAYGLMVVK